MKYFKIIVGVVLILAASRFIPHPPNFTSLIALSFYIPAIFGIKFIPVVIFAFLMTDLFIGFHSLMFFTWGSVLIIGLISKYFYEKISQRILALILSIMIFFIVSNFGVWLIGNIYTTDLQGLINCYILALPFLGNTILSTILFSLIIEVAIFYLKNKKYFIKNYSQL